MALGTVIVSPPVFGFAGLPAVRPGMSLFRTVFQEVAGLTVEGFANGVERRETDGLGLACLENRKVSCRNAYLLSKFSRRHFPPSQHYINIDNDGHDLHFLTFNVRMI